MTMQEIQQTVAKIDHQQELREEAGLKTKIVITRNKLNWT